MARATGYKPMGGNKKRKIARHPDEIFRCYYVDGDKYVLVKQWKGRGRRGTNTYEMVDCKLDYPAEYIIEYIIDGGCYSVDGYKRNDNYELELINYHLLRKCCNEYELRNLMMEWLKKKRKVMDKSVFRTACGIFDKADKMLARADKRKNSNHNEADVSYNFMIRNYVKIVGMCEVKVDNKAVNKTVADANKAAVDVVIDGVLYGMGSVKYGNAYTFNAGRMGSARYSGI